jgi:DeoR family transcriptional regulator, copper-sensing transcriptional repressor
MNTLATDRQRKIIEILRSAGSIDTHSLASELGVSTMTIHRDLNKLADAGVIHKVHGGATLQQPHESPTRPEFCSMCKKTVQDRTGFYIHTKEGIKKSACCPHCGLILLKQTPNVESAIATDYLYGTIVSITQATFLMHSEITVCCSPTILCFANPEDAIRFQRGFGGTLADLQTARQFIHKTMQP